MAGAAKYVVYVQDHAGWLDGCPDYRTVFFGHHDPAGGVYVHSLDAASCRHEVQFRLRRDAVAFRDLLNATGDWTPADGGPELRPTYAVAKL